MRCTAHNRSHGHSRLLALLSALAGLLALAPGCGPQLGDGAEGPGAPQVDGPARSQTYRGRITRDGRAFVAREGGAHFPFRGVSEFLLPFYLFDPARPAGQGEAIVAGRMDLRARQGYTVLRVFGAVDWSESGSPVKLRPFDDLPRWQEAMRRTLELARERGLYVEWVVLTDVGKTVPKDRAGELVERAAALAQASENTFVEIVNEGWKNGLSRDEIFELGRRFKAGAPDVLLAGTSAQDEGKDYGAAPFDYVTIHGERADGDDGWRWVRHLREGELVGGEVDKPVVQDEPMGSAAAAVPGRRDDSAGRFRAAALVCHASRQYFTFHHECAVQPTASPTCDDVPTPGADEVRRSDLISSDPRDGRFLNGQWPEAPFDAGNAFDSGALLRLYTKSLADGTGFFSYPVHVKQDVQLRLRAAIALTVVDVGSGEVRSSRDYAAGESLALPAGSDVVIVGGKAVVPEPPPPPPPPPPMDPVPQQQAAADVAVRGYTAAQAQAIVERLYLSILGRPVDPSGLGAYAPLVASGRLPRVTSALVTSPEFDAHRATISVQRLSADLYQGILGRAPDAGGDAGTQGAIKAGGTAQRAADMVLSPEYEANRL